MLNGGFSQENNSEFGVFVVFGHGPACQRLPVRLGLAPRMPGGQRSNAGESGVGPSYPIDYSIFKSKIYVFSVLRSTFLRDLRDAPKIISFALSTENIAPGELPGRSVMGGVAI